MPSLLPPAPSSAPSTIALASAVCRAQAHRSCRQHNPAPHHAPPLRRRGHPLVGLGSLVNRSPPVAAALSPSAALLSAAPPSLAAALLSVASLSSAAALLPSPPLPSAPLPPPFPQPSPPPLCKACRARPDQAQTIRAPPRFRPAHRCQSAGIQPATPPARRARYRHAPTPRRPAPHHLELCRLAPWPPHRCSSSPPSSHTPHTNTLACHLRVPGRSRCTVWLELARASSSSSHIESAQHGQAGGRCGC